MRRSLIYFWRMNVAVAAATAVATAVLTGALIVGDSLRESLRHLTLDRLGQIELALVNDRFFPVDLASRLAQESADTGSTIVETAILLRGTATHADSDRRASKVQIVGVQQSLANLFPESGTEVLAPLERSPGQVFPSVVLNEPLRRELEVQPGDDILLSVGRAGEVPQATLFGRREEAELIDTLRLTVTGIVPGSGIGGFSPEARQNRPLNAFVQLPVLQRRLERRQEVNTLLIGGVEQARASTSPTPGDLREKLAGLLTLEDHRLRLRPAGGSFALESRELLVRSGVVEATIQIAEEAGATTWPILTYLANSMTIGDRLLPYSTVTALPIPQPEALGRLLTTDGEPIANLEPDQILLNSWAAEDLTARAADRLDMSYFVVDRADELSIERASFEVAGIVSLRELAADRSLTPDVPGISEVDDIAGWRPPFPVELDLVRPKDEAYWDAFGATPKAFVQLATGQRLWSSRYGGVTSIRLLPAADTDPGEFEQTLRREIPRRLGLEESGFRWLRLRSQGLEAAAGSTDFSGLFLGFSLFLIVSAVLLVALLFTLLVDQRCREAGLLLALGFPTKRVRRRLMAEGLILALVGNLMGLALALVYAGMVLRGLATWWSPVVEAPFLELHSRPTSLTLGAFVSLSLVMLTIARAVRRLSRIPARRLLSGEATEVAAGRHRRLAPWVAALAAGLALLLLVGALLAGTNFSPVLFFAVGAALVAAGVAGFAHWCARHRSKEALGGRFTDLRMAVRNSARNLGRSLLSVTLVSCACFILVSVNANRKSHRVDPTDRLSGTGGLGLVAETDTAMPADLEKLLADAIPTAEASALGRLDVYSLRTVPGDDASCLNLYQPERPRLLGVPSDFVQRGGFGFRASMAELSNPWELLEQPLEDGVIPVIGDYNSVRWILHLGLGQEVPLVNDLGEPVRLRIVGLLDTSIFQSELLLSEANFLRHFPDHPGYGYFLLDEPVGSSQPIASALEERFSSFGLDVTSTADRLAAYLAVEAMYLSTFEALGGFGLLLGTLGLGLVLYRNVLERRRELAVLRAFGFRRSNLARMVVIENVVLLAVGVVIGCGAGLTAVAPHLSGAVIELPWRSLSALVTGVLALGVLASTAAVANSLRVPLLPALKTD